VIVLHIPYASHTIDDSDIAAVVDVLKGNFLTTGPKIKEFEQAICDEVGSKYAVAVSNGTAALHIAAMAAGIGAEDEVIVPAITFAASANCVLYCGATPVFADVDKDTLLMDLDDAKRKITSKTKAIIPVHFGGEVCDMDAYEQLAKEHGLHIIQDSAHSLGSKVRRKGQGKFSGQQIWSFHPAKTITTGEGGAITTNDENLYKTLLRLRTHGITRDTSQYINQNHGGWYYEMLDLGFNYRLTDMQAALGISQMQKLPQFAKRRAEIVAHYDKVFDGLPFQVQKSPEWSSPVRHLYTTRMYDKNRRLEVFDALQAKGIGVNVHYIPVHLMPYYKKIGYKPGLCSVAEDAYERLITLPLYPAMTDEMVEYVVSAVNEVMG